MSKKSMCGILYTNNEYTPIYCDTSTGECYFRDPFMGDMRLLSEISIDDPVDIDYPSTLSDMVAGEYDECIGVIFDGEQVLCILSEDRAVYRDASDLATDVGEVFHIDIYQDYDGDIEDV